MSNSLAMKYENFGFTLAALEEMMPILGSSATGRKDASVPQLHPEDSATLGKPANRGFPR
jgi:hypothetical protein